VNEPSGLPSNPQSTGPRRGKSVFVPSGPFTVIWIGDPVRFEYRRAWMYSVAFRLADDEALGQQTAFIVSDGTGHQQPARCFFCFAIPRLGAAPRILSIQRALFLIVGGVRLITGPYPQAFCCAGMACHLITPASFAASFSFSLSRVGSCDDRGPRLGNP